MYPTPYSRGYNSAYSGRSQATAIAPTVRAVQTGGTSGNVNPALPAHQAGDTLIVAGVWDLGTSATASGWTVLSTVANNDFELRVFKKENVSGTDTNLNPNVTAALAVAVAVDGTAVDAFSSSTTAVSSAEISCPAVTVTAAPVVLLRFAFVNRFSTVPDLTAPDTQLADIARAAFLIALVAGSKAISANGTTGAGAAPVTPSSTGAAISVAIR